MPRRPRSAWLLWLVVLLTAGPAAAAEPEHWAYRPLPGSPSVPEIGKPTANPVDAFIRRELAAQGLKPAPPADRRTLLRRVYFDLTGLPPTPDELRAFLADPSTNAYAHVVDRLLSSPRYGERWARHWMDAAHFAETHGNDQDRIRTNAWPYRDYLIDSFNEDKPYARFVQEQIAGDVLFPDHPPATVALGFIAAGPWDESSLRDIREDTLDRQIGRYLDRDDMVMTVMSVMNSTTVHCARCHDHKFDPVSQRDYYALQAVFAGVDRANRTYDIDPAVHQRRHRLRQQQLQLERRDPALLSSPETVAEVAAWELARREHPTAWTVVDPQTFVSAGGATLTRQPDHSLLASGTRPERDTYTLTAAPPVSQLSAFRLEVLPDESLPKQGPGRADNGNFHLSEIQLLLFEPGAAQPRDVPLVNPSADFDQVDWTLSRTLDHNDKTAWGIHPQEGAAHQAVFELKEALTLPSGATLVWVLKQLHGEGHVIGRLRLAVTDSSTPVRVLSAEVEQLLALPAAQRSEDQQIVIAAELLTDRIRRQQAALPPASLVYAAASDYEPDGGLKPTRTPRPVAVLRRGEITKPLEPAEPGALGCVTALPARFTLAQPDDEGARRAALARWLTSPDNPLTWRSIVNRVWLHHFGRGLVDTPNDFGHMGGVPSHPELLDWLAVWFRNEAHGSFKELHRLLVTSATYQQSSVMEESGVHPAVPDPAPSKADPDNRLLAHMNRTRLDAESVRDAILQVSGRLNLRMGGPGDQQFDLKPGIHVTPRVDYTLFDVDSAAGSRRSVYRFLFRTLPDPFMDALDCPAGDQLTAARNNTVTVQQALAMWNDRFVARHAEHLAASLAAHASEPNARVGLACELIWGRPPEAGEARDLAAYAGEYGWANLCRLLLNSNEFMFVN